MYFFKLILIQNLAQTEIFAPKLISNLTLTQTLILTLKKYMKNGKINIPHFCFVCFNLENVHEIVSSFQKHIMMDCISYLTVSRK